ncbi:MAG: NB-ARC domain-containing protein, partial [Bacteroidota bacterium]
MKTHTKQSIVITLLFSGLLQSCYSPNISAPEIPTTQAKAMSVCAYVPFEEQNTDTHTLDPVISAQGHQLCFTHESGEWKATATEQLGPFFRTAVLPVVCEDQGDIASFLSDLQNKPADYAQRLVHVVRASRANGPAQFVYLGRQGLRGGGNTTSGLQCCVDTGQIANRLQASYSNALREDSVSSAPLIRRNTQPQDIETAQDLVAALNTAQTHNQLFFQEWVESYIAWFNNQSVRNLTPTILHEYTQLAHIQLQSDSPQNVELLADYVYSLLYRISKTRYRKNPLMQALRYSLATLDPRVFHHMVTEEPEVFTDLASDLLNKIDSNSALAFTKRNYAFYHNLFHILGQTLLLIHQLHAGDWDPDHERGLYQQFMQKLTAVEQSASYYPFRYDARLLKQVLQHVKRQKTFSESLQGRAMSGFKALVELSGCLADGPPFINPDLGKLLNACGHIKEVFLPRGGTTSTWYLHLIPLMRTATATLKDPDKYTDFAQSLSELNTQPLRLAYREDEQALYFSVVRQVYRLALEGPTSAVRSQSIEKLSELTEGRYGTHREVMCELLDSLALLTHSNTPDRSVETGKARDVLEQLVTHTHERRTQRKQIILRDWLGQKTLDQKRNSLLLATCTSTLPSTRHRSASFIIPNRPSSNTRKVHQAKALLAPPDIAFFVGREQPTQQIQHHLQARQDLSVVILTGPGGIGKTQLARKIFVEQERSMQDGYLLWIPAATEQSLTSAYLRIAETLSIDTTSKKDPRQVVETVRDSLKSKDGHHFYVFDDASDMNMLQGFLPKSNGRVLITSRNGQPAAGGRAWEHIVLPPFDVQEAIDLAQQFGYGQSDAEQETLRSFVNHMSCAPLTLVQLFSTLEDQGWDLLEYLNALQSHDPTALEREIMYVLGGDAASRTQYGQSMVYVVRQSLEQLCKASKGKAALQLLKQLSYLDATSIPVAWLYTWDPEPGCISKSWIRPALSLLQQYSLIQRSQDRRQVYVHADTQLILRHLYAKDTTQVLKTTAHSLVKYVSNPNSAQQDKEVRYQLLPHGRILFERLDTDQYSPEAYTLAEYLTAVCRATCLFPESVAWATECLRLIQRRYPNQDQPEVAYSLNRLGASLVETAQHEAALSYKQQALDMRRRLFGSTPLPFLPFLRQASPDHEDIAYSLSEVGGSLAQLGRYE